jgi:putative DNA primase/helicase
MTAGHNVETIRQALLDRAEDLFRQAWGEPEKAGAKDWRAKSSSARSMVMRGPKRGIWRDHKANDGGDLLDFFAIEFCGLTAARDDFPRVIDEAARWCGLSLDAPIDLSALDARKAAREAQGEAEAAKDAQIKAALVKALQARSEALSGSPAAAYLAARGITSLPSGWRYLPPAPGLGVRHPDRAALMVPAIDDMGVVRGGQRILILPDGSKAPEDPRKPAFGSIGGFPARIPADKITAENSALMICEGPETAAAIAQATGFETWAVFGVSGFASAPAPIGRKVVFCPDQDAAGSPAADNFVAACIAQAARGVDLWIARAPEPEGSKRDLNDTLMRAGADALAAAVEGAVRFVAPEAAQGRVVLPARADLPDSKLTTLQAALAGCGGPTSLSVALAVAYRLLRRVPVEMSIDGVMAFLAVHLPPGAMTDAEQDAIKARLVWMQGKRRETALAHVSLPASVHYRHDLRQVTSLEPLPPETLRGVICVRAPMGKGKTQSIGKPFVQWAKSQGGGVMAICHRVTLTGELSRRLDLADYQSATAASIEEKGGVAVCLPSTTLQWMAEAMPKPRFVFVDEIAQVLQFLAADGQCRTRDASPAGVFDRLVQIVRDAEVVLVADAGLDARSIGFLEYCRPGERFQVIEMQAQDEGKRAEVITGAQPNEVKQAVVDRAFAELAAGGKVWLATESKKRAEALESLFFAQGFKAISITATNKANERQEAFLRNAEHESRLYDVVIASPAISSGLSIEHRGNPHFTLGAYIGSGSETAPADAVQQLGRVRYLQRFAVGIMRNNLPCGQTWEAIVDGLLGAAAIEGNPAKATTFDALVSDVEAQAANAKADFGAGLWWILEGQGWALERAEAMAGDGAVKAAEDAWYQARRAALIGADLIDDATADMLKTIARSEADELRLEAWKIRKTFGVIDLDDATIDLWDGGHGVTRLERFEDLTGAAVERRDDSGNALVHRRYRAAKMRLYADLFEGFDISRTDWCGPDAVALLVDRVMARAEVFAAVGIVGPKYRARFTGKDGKPKAAARPTGTKATWMVKEILDRAGLVWVSKRVRLSQTPPFLVNTNRGVWDKTEGSDDNRQRIGGTCPASLAMMQSIIDRRAVFDLDAEIAARVPADPEVMGAAIEPEPDALLKNADTVAVEVIPHDALVWARAAQLQRETAEGRRRRRARDAERLMGAAVDDGCVALQRLPMPAPRPRRRILIKPRLQDPDNRIDANLSQPLSRYAVEDDGPRLIWWRGLGDMVAEVFEQWRALDDPGNPDAWA